MDAPIHPRSANKLMQAAGMRSLGLRLEGEQLALSAASHWGEPRHVDAVRAILASAGLDESALQTTPALPEDADARRAVVRGDGVARPIYHGCSGKHAAMLATCVVRGWDTATYLEPDHPLQVALRGPSGDGRRRPRRAHGGRRVRRTGMGDPADRAGPCLPDAVTELGPGLPAR